MNRERVHQHLYTVWMCQACQNPAHWPDAFARYMANAPKTQGEGMASSENHGRGSLRRLFNEAVDALIEAFSAETPPDDPADVVWRTFPRLDLVHRTRLAKILMEERQYHAELS